MKGLSRSATYSGHPEMPEDAPTLAPFYAPVVDLRESRVAVHLRELELCLSSCSLRKGGVADNVAKCLSKCPDLCQQAVRLLSFSPTPKQVYDVVKSALEKKISRSYLWVSYCS